MAVKKYVINYSAIGGGAIEVEAHSIREAEDLADCCNMMNKG